MTPDLAIITSFCYLIAMTAEAATSPLRGGDGVVISRLGENTSIHGCIMDNAVTVGAVTWVHGGWCGDGTGGESPRSLDGPLSLN